MKKTRKIKAIPDEDDYEALDRVARNITLDMLQPMSPRGKMLWEAAKRGRGRPRKAAADRSVPIQITMQPGLLKDIDALADKSGKSRSELIADGARLVLKQKRRKAS